MKNKREIKVGDLYVELLLDSFLGLVRVRKVQKNGRVLFEGAETGAKLTSVWQQTETGDLVEVGTQKTTPYFQELFERTKDWKRCVHVETAEAALQILAHQKRRRDPEMEAIVDKVLGEL